MMPTTTRLAPTLLLVCFTGCLAASAGEVSDSQQKWVAHYKSQRNIPQPSEMLINEDAEPDLADGFASLYNGKNLDGWTPYGGDCTFEAKGETIVGQLVKGSPSTYLSTDKNDFADFVFTAEIKMEVPGNTGIMFRAGLRPENPKRKHRVVFGPQCEMEEPSKKRGWSGGIYGQADGGWIYPLWLEAHEDARNAVNYDDWNRITIKAHGETLQTWINGVPAAHWKTDRYKQGFFSLQVHSGNQGTIHFRNIKVKELTTAE